MRIPIRSAQAHALCVYLSVAVLVAPLLGIAEPARMGVIKGDGVTLREGPGVNFEKVGRLMKGDWVTILETEGEWHKVLDPKGQMAWVFSRWVDEVPMESEKAGSGLLSVTTIESPDQGALPDSAPPPPLMQEGGRRLPWLWIGAGAVAVGVVGVLALSGGDDSSAGSLSFHVEFP